MQLNYASGLAYAKYQTTRVASRATEAHGAALKVKETYRAARIKLKRKDDENGLDMGKYFLISKTPED